MVHPDLFSIFALSFTNRNINMTLRELVFMCMDEVKLNSDDSYYTEDHVVFLLNKYRSFVLKKELEKENKQLSSTNGQTICLDLIEVRDEENPCGGAMLRTEQTIPNLVNDCKVSLYPINYFDGDHIIFTTMERMRYTTYNKWTQNLIYAAKGPDDYLYLKSSNPQYLYLEKLRMKAVFEDFEDAAQYACDDSGEELNCDILDMKFPLENALVPTVIELVMKELLGASYRPKDSTNNANDDLSDIIAWARKNMKSGLQKQIES